MKSFAWRSLATRCRASSSRAWLKEMQRKPCHGQRRQPWLRYLLANNKLLDRPPGLLQRRMLGLFRRSAYKRGLDLEAEDVQKSIETAAVQHSGHLRSSTDHLHPAHSRSLITIIAVIHTLGRRTLSCVSCGCFRPKNTNATYLRGGYAACLGQLNWLRGGTMDFRMVLKMGTAQCQFVVLSIYTLQCL